MENEHSETQPAQPNVRPPQEDRWVSFLLLTLLIDFVCYFVHAATICGCHFHPEAVPFSIIPIAWGFYPFFFWRTGRERAVGYLAIALSALMFYWAFQDNLLFAIRAILR